jgi:hypothetical protein
MGILIALMLQMNQIVIVSIGSTSVMVVVFPSSSFVMVGWIAMMDPMNMKIATKIVFQVHISLVVMVSVGRQTLYVQDQHNVLMHLMKNKTAAVHSQNLNAQMDCVLVTICGVMTMRIAWMNQMKSMTALYCVHQDTSHVMAMCV